MKNAIYKNEQGKIKKIIVYQRSDFNELKDGSLQLKRRYGKYKRQPQIITPNEVQ